MTSSTLRVVRSNTTAADAYDKHVAAISIDGDRVGEIPLGGIRTFLSRQGSTKPAFDSAATSALEESWQRARKRHHHRHVHKSAVCQRPAEHPSPQPLLVVANQLKRCMLRAMSARGTPIVPELGVTPWPVLLPDNDAPCNAGPILIIDIGSPHTSRGADRR